MIRSFLLKLSGEALAASEQDIISPSMLKAYSDEIECAINNKVGIAVVIGGGNYFRGASLQSSGIERVIADKMGMLATLCLLYTSPSPRDRQKSRMPSSA